MGFFFKTCYQWFLNIFSTIFNWISIFQCSISKKSKSKKLTKTIYIYMYHTNLYTLQCFHKKKVGMLKQKTLGESCFVLSSLRCYFEYRYKIIQTSLEWIICNINVMVDIRGLLNWYWWIFTQVGCKNARACECILKPTSVNIHQYVQKRLYHIAKPFLY